MKKIIHLTLSVIVITGMLFSVSGMKFHFHYCGSKGKMYADIHLISDNNYEHANCSVNSKCNFCCEHSDKQSSCAEDLSQCCYDVDTRIITETEYEGKQHHHKIVLSGIILLHSPVPENPSHFISLSKAPKDFVPPDLVSTIVLMI